MRRVAVLGGNDPAAAAELADAADALGRLLAAEGLTLLHDGSATGPHRALAAGFSEAGGLAVQAPSPEDAVRQADGLIALPGGQQRMEQLFALALDGGPESRPVGLLNAGNFFTALLATEPDRVLERFAQETQRGRLIVDRNPKELLQAMRDFRPPETRRHSP